MLFFYLALLAHTFILNVTSMPYSVPLQGVVGGKRTLVLLDDLVKSFCVKIKQSYHYLTCCLK